MQPWPPKFGERLLKELDRSYEIYACGDKLKRLEPGGWRRFEADEGWVIVCQ